VRDLVLEAARDVSAFPKEPVWQALSGCGTEPWLDTGDVEAIEGLWTQEFRALTTNNTLLNREVQKGIYDGLIAKAAKALKGKVGEQELVLEIAFILNAVHGLMLSARFRARVSVELHTDLAHDAARSVAYGVRYHEIAPHHFYVKVPFAAEGLLAAQRLGKRGVPVNFTLGFSARQNYVITRVAAPAFVNVFLGRLNSFVADHGLGDGKMVGEKATLSSQRAVRALREELGLGTRQIAASMREGAQVATLAGVDVHTMPPKVAQEFLDSGAEPGSLSSQVEADPEIALAEGVDRAALGIDVLWDVPDSLQSAVTALAEKDMRSWQGPEVAGFLSAAGFPDFLPDWSEADVAQVTTDGKIPAYETWKDRLASGEVGLDALMNISALQSFATDQKAMDDRIRENL
jgi:transaldolase